MNARLIMLLAGLAGQAWACTAPFDPSVLYRCSSDADCVAGYACRLDLAQGVDLCLPADRFVIESDAVVTDRDLGLLWTRDGNILPLQTVTSDPCPELTLDGRGWRLPDIDELRTLIVGCTRTQPHGECNVSTRCSAAGNSDHCNAGASCDACDAATDPPPAGSTCYWRDELWATDCFPRFRSSTLEPEAQKPWGVEFDTGAVALLVKWAEGPVVAFCVSELDPAAR